MEEEDKRIEQLKNHIKKIDNEIANNGYSTGLKLARQKTVEKLQALQVNKFFR
ncbi:hypothetical protein [Clostridium tetani]|uniref:hypothetical protein n=1 Tax=Clostridium tetani TaxID=1513 RepID=UPI0003C0D329|nr:hypothetical protein [Clostridium tetani]CDI50302.1 hypothetical protein BN906_02318 [Clostridium tetani 12124569]